MVGLAVEEQIQESLEKPVEENILEGLGKIAKAFTKGLHHKPRRRVASLEGVKPQPAPAPAPVPAQPPKPGCGGC